MQLAMATGGKICDNSSHQWSTIQSKLSIYSESARWKQTNVIDIEYLRQNAPMEMDGRAKMLSSYGHNSYVIRSGRMHTLQSQICKIIQHTAE